MKKLILFLILSISIFSYSYCQGSKVNGYAISITIDGWEDSVAYLGYYIGTKTYLQDTAMVENKKATFTGSQKLTSGLYFLYTPNNLFFEFLVNEAEFSLETNISDISGQMQVINSKENQLFFNYQNKLLGFQDKAKNIKDEVTDSITRIKELKSVNNDVKRLQEGQRDLSKGTYFSEFLSLLIRPNISVPKEIPSSEASNYRIREYKKHFWDGVNFENPGIIRNPVFDPKLTEYFDRLVYNVSDSIAKEIDAFLSQPMDTVVFRYLIVSLTNKYATSKGIDHDAVYVHMVDQYYATGKAYWIDDVTLTRMKQNTDRLKPILIGQIAPLFRSENINGEVIQNPFATTDKAYKIMFFYDSGCGHCKKATPKLMESFHNLKESNVSVDVISMNLSEDKEEWEIFIKTYGLEGQILGDTKTVSNAGYYYYIDTTPQIFILDQQNKIIGKKIGAEYVDDFLENYLSNQIK